MGSFPILTRSPRVSISTRGVGTSRRIPSTLLLSRFLHIVRKACSTRSLYMCNVGGTANAAGTRSPPSSERIRAVYNDARPAEEACKIPTTSPYPPSTSEQKSNYRRAGFLSMIFQRLTGTQWMAHGVADVCCPTENR